MIDGFVVILIDKLLNVKLIFAFRDIEISEKVCEWLKIDVAPAVGLATCESRGLEHAIPR